MSKKVGVDSIRLSQHDLAILELSPMIELAISCVWRCKPSTFYQLIDRSYVKKQKQRNNKKQRKEMVKLG